MIRRYLFDDPCDPDEGRFCSVASALIGGGLGLAGTIGGSLIGSNAQTNASNNAIATQKSMFGEAKNALSPFIDAGKGGIANLQSFIDPNNANSPLAALLKLVMPGANMTDTLSQTPGYQFTEDKGLRAVNNALAARGLAGSGGAVAKGAGDYVTGLASNTWQSVVNSLLSVFTGGVGSMQGLVNTGANSAGNLAGGAITSGNNIAGNQIGIGNAQAGAATNIGAGLGNFGNSLSTAMMLNKLTGAGGSGGGSMYDTSANAMKG